MIKLGKIGIVLGTCCLAALCSVEKNPEKASGVALPAPPALKEYSSAEVSFIISLLDSLSENGLKADILALQEMGTRYAPSEGNRRAAEYLQAALRSAGIQDIRLEEFRYFNEYSGFYDSTRNVIASKPGKKSPEKKVVICAHFDTVSRRSDHGLNSFLDKESPSPGADDNATGVAAVLAAARVLSAYDFDATLCFAAFSAEEAGIFGSARYAAECARNHHEILGVINLDMIGYIDQEPEDIDIFADPASEWLLDVLINDSPVYAPGLQIFRLVNGHYDGSDHGPFWNNGYSAVGFMEDYYPSNRLYHTPSDTMETLDLGFALKCTKLAVGTMAELAGIQIPGDGLKRAGEETGLRKINWKESSGKKLLLVLAPSSNRADVIDITFPEIHAKKSCSLGEVPAESYSTPRFFPVDAARMPSQRTIFIPMIKLRATGRESEAGRLAVVDIQNNVEVKSVATGKFPGSGCFSPDGKKFWLPYEGEKYLEVFDSVSFRSITKIPVSVPLTKVVAGEARGLALSPETHTVLILNIREDRVERTVEEIPLPLDAVLLADDFGLVCSDDPAKLHLLNLKTGRTAGSWDVGPRPRRLALSPRNDTVLLIYQGAMFADLFHIVRNDSGLSLRKETRLDFDEELIDGTFASDNQTLFFISGKMRLFGFDLTGRKMFWGMRTGDVRPSRDLTRIFYLDLTRH